MLCDTVEDSDDYVVKAGCTLNTFPLEYVAGAKVTLHSLKMGVFYQLLSSETSECMHFDSQFSVMQANVAAFESVSHDGFDAGDDQ